MKKQTSKWRSRIDTIQYKDCLPGMKGMPDECIDLIVTDPNWRECQEIDLQLKEMCRLLKTGRHIFMIWHSLSAFKVQSIFENHFELLNIVILRRKNFCGNCWDKERLPFQWYPAFFGSKGRPSFKIIDRKFELNLASDVWDYLLPQSNHKKDPRLHQWQKDLITIKKMIALCSDPGEIVLDAFMGSGTTAVACQELDRRFIGFEIDRGNKPLCEKRLSQQAMSYRE